MEISGYIQLVQIIMRYYLQGNHKVESPLLSLMYGEFQGEVPYLPYFFNVIIRYLGFHGEVP